VPDETPKDPGKALLLAWLIPGAGHWYAAQRGRAVLYAVTVIGTFLAGLWMGGLATVSVTGQKWAFLLQLFDGPLAILSGIASHAAEAARQAALAVGHTAVPPLSPTRLSDLGLTFTLVSAAFNVLVIADAYWLADRSGEEPAA
jgi:hypothetical protein